VHDREHLHQQDHPSHWHRRVGHAACRRDGVGRGGV